MNPATLKYTKSHEWIEPAGAVRKVGITDFAQHELGDIVFVDFPAPGKTVQPGEEVCVIESTKATSPIYAPVAGKIVKFNEALVKTPESINEKPFDDGWLYEMEIAAGVDEGGLLDEAAYQAASSEGH